ncbi:MAG: hypothetical protein R3B71_05340 [Candidatus Gracilibacteria bacterium]|nr:hypothetical protein [Candidatus Peregrinibacteria bacterium]
MKKTKKVFLPKWIRWIMMPMFVLLWIFITYLEFFSPEQGELGLFGYIVISVVFLGIAIMMWLMSSGKLPAYIIEEDE